MKRTLWNILRLRTLGVLHVLHYYDYGISSPVLFHKFVSFKSKLIELLNIGNLKYVFLKSQVGTAVVTTKTKILN